MQEILKNERICLFQNAHQVISSLDALTLNLKSFVLFSGVPKPRIYYFEFDGHSPGIVPLSGVRLTLRGFRLWDKQPGVELLDVDRKLIKVLSADKASDDNCVSTLIDADTIKNYAGADLHCAGAFEKFCPLATPFQTVMLPNVTTYLGCAVALWAAHAPRSNPVAIAKRMKKRGKYMAIGPMVFLSGR